MKNQVFKIVERFLRTGHRLFISSSSPSSRRTCSYFSHLNSPSLRFANKPISISSYSSAAKPTFQEDGHHPSPGEYTEQEDEDSEEELWEDEGDSAPKNGDGGSGGGVVLNNVSWGERALSIAHDALLQFNGDLKLFAFKATPRGHVFVRLDKPSHKYGCPSLNELESYNNELKLRLDDARERGEIREALGVKVSTPGADRLLKIPEDLDRFKEMAMQVCYLEGEESGGMEKTRVLILESLEEKVCIWKLANVKENRNPLGKGRPLSHKLQDWRLKLPFEMHKTVSLHIP